jgi:homoaconitase/3-isopropylmalate dehydratase large subunit
VGTLVEEIFSRRLGRHVHAGEIVIAEVDSMMSHDNTTPLAVRAWQGIVSSFTSITLTPRRTSPPPSINARHSTSSPPKASTTFFTEESVIK